MNSFKRMMGCLMWLSAAIGDISAILDTVRAITLAAATLSAGTVLLNTLAHFAGRE